MICKLLPKQRKVGIISSCINYIFNPSDTGKEYEKKKRKYSSTLDRYDKAKGHQIKRCLYSLIAPWLR